MTVLVFGAQGQVGRAIGRLRPGVIQLGRAQADITDPRAVRSLLARHRPSVVIQAAAYTDVDRAEIERARAFAVNTAGAAHVASACADLGVALVHLSTDYVFDGTKGAPYVPDDVTRPLNVYGATKAAGEDAVRASGARHVILRTAWVFSADRPGFVGAVLRLARAGQPLRVVSDVYGNPTPATDVARAALAAADRLVAGTLDGTWHVGGAPGASWYDLAVAACQAARVHATIGAVPASSWPTRAARPRDTRLELAPFAAATGLSIDWRARLPGIVGGLS